MIGSSRRARAHPSRPSVAPIGDRTFDDHYALEHRPHVHRRSRRSRATAHLRRQLSLRAAVRAAARGEFLAIEPMTATDRCARPRGNTDVRTRRPVRRVVHDFLLVTGDAMPARLLPPGAYTGFLGDLCVPDDLFWVHRAPVALVGMAYPGRADWSLLHEHGIGHVVALTHATVPYDASPCSVSAYPLQDLVSGGPPRDAEQNAPRSTRRRSTSCGTCAAVSVSPCTASVVVAVPARCSASRSYSSVTRADDVIDYFHRVNVGRGRRGWPESEWQASVVRDTPTLGA